MAHSIHPPTALCSPSLSEGSLPFLPTPIILQVPVEKSRVLLQLLKGVGGHLPPALASVQAVKKSYCNSAQTQNSNLS